MRTYSRKGIRRKRAVIKIGSSVLLNDKGKFDYECMLHIVGQIVVLRQRDVQVAIVVSGAVACGASYLEGVHTTRGKRVAAAIGQIELILFLRKVFGRAGIKVAQVLRTSGTGSGYCVETYECFEDCLTYQGDCKAWQVEEGLLEAGVIPLINENDAVQLNGFEGNDILAARVASLLDADYLLILSTKTRSKFGIGGGKTKLEALEYLRIQNEEMCAYILDGRAKNVIIDNVV